MNAQKLWAGQYIADPGRVDMIAWHVVSENAVVGKLAKTKCNERIKVEVLQRFSLTEAEELDNGRNMFCGGCGRP